MNINSSPITDLDIERLGSSFSGPTLSGEGSIRDWDMNMMQVSIAMIRAALRIKSKENIFKTIETFGGLPPEGSSAAGMVLRYAAMEPDAFGFEELLEQLQKQFLDSKNLKLEEVRDDTQNKNGRYIKRELLGGWLRDGLFNSYFDGENFNRNGLLNLEAKSNPVALCFLEDNPIALASILKNPVRRAALLSLEPQTMSQLEVDNLLTAVKEKSNSYQLNADLARCAEENNIGFEKSLLWQAIYYGAFRCASLLASLPEFASILHHSNRFLVAIPHRNWYRRVDSEIFEKASEKDGGVEFNIFEWIASECSSKKLNSGSRHSSRHIERVENSAKIFIQSVIEHASEEAKNFKQKGTSMGWSEIFFENSAPHRWGNAVFSGNKYAEASILDAMKVLSLFEKKGFRPQWDLLAEVSKDCELLYDWLSVKASASEVKSDSLGPKKVISL